MSLVIQYFFTKGATSGIGKEVTRQFGKRGATIHMLCRNEQKGLETINELSKEIPKENLILHIVDVSIPKDVLNFCQNFKSQYKQLDVLVNNAGVLLMGEERKLTKDGLELTFATNSFGPFLLTEQLMPILNLTENSRVISITSGGMLTQKLNSRDLQLERTIPFDGIVSYAQTKRQMVEMGHYWAKEHPNILFLSAHPGWAETPGVIESMPSFYNHFKNNLRNVEQGADCIVWSSISSSAKGIQNGSFIGDRKIESEHLFWAGTEATEEERLLFVNKLISLKSEFENSSKTTVA